MTKEEIEALKAKLEGYPERQERMRAEIEFWKGECERLGLIEKAPERRRYAPSRGLPKKGSDRSQVGAKHGGTGAPAPSTVLGTLHSMTIEERIKMLQNPDTARELFDQASRER